MSFSLGLPITVCQFGASLRLDPRRILVRVAGLEHLFPF
jgi:hypothetical protein